VVVIVAVISILAVLLFPALRKATVKSKRIACVSNLKQLGLGFRVYATDHSGRYPMSSTNNPSQLKDYLRGGNAYRYFLSLSNEIGTPNVLLCPLDKTRVAATHWPALRNENISYFLGLDADETQPQSLLSGDSHLATNGVAVKSGLLELTTHSVVDWTLERHAGGGNLVVGDGSVQQATSARWQSMIGDLGTNTIRLVIP
jgi:type II secretory pathway pseudopilin PulG